MQFILYLCVCPGSFETSTYDMKFNVFVIFKPVTSVSGLLQADTGVIRDGKQIFRLFCHESMRVFHDRLINNEDKKYFHTMLSEMASKHFGEVMSKSRNL